MARNPVIFENGTLIQNAKVEIDGVIYDVQPAQFDGSTPLSANNLNRAQTNLYDYVDEKTTQEIQTFTERVIDNRNSNRNIDICWKKIGNIVQINIDATIPPNGSSTMTINNFNFHIPDWAKVNSNYNNILFQENVYLISTLRSIIADSDGVKRGFNFNLLYNYSTNIQYIYGNLMNLTSNTANVRGTITYIVE
jgi:hypothetical protein